MSVGEICNRQVIVAAPDESVTELVRLMREYHVGDVVVVEERAGERVPVGIVTDRDIVIEVLAEDVEPLRVAARDIMSVDLQVGSEHDEVMEVIKRMREHGIRRLPIVNDAGGLVGIVSVDDLIELLAEHLSDLARLVTIEQRRERTARSS